MSYPIFYEPEPFLKSSLGEDESYHAAKVLRLKSGDQINIVNGRGSRFQAVLDVIDFKMTTFKSLLILEENSQPTYSICLWVAPTKQLERMEWMVEKCTEFGINSIGFFSSRYSERKEIKLNRLEKIAISALKQSKNLFKPQLNPIVPIKEIIQLSENKNHSNQYLFAHIADPLGDPLFKVFEKNKNYHIMIGPEGDFSKEESDLIIVNHWQPFSLGKPILRTETACISATQSIHLLQSIHA